MDGPYSKRVDIARKLIDAFEPEMSRFLEFFEIHYTDIEPLEGLPWGAGVSVDQYMNVFIDKRFASVEPIEIVAGHLICSGLMHVKRVWGRMLWMEEEHRRIYVPISCALEIGQIIEHPSALSSGIAIASSEHFRQLKRAGVSGRPRLHDAFPRPKALSLPHGKSAETYARMLMLADGIIDDDQDVVQVEYLASSGAGFGDDAEEREDSDGGISSNDLEVNAEELQGCEGEEGTCGSELTQDQGTEHGPSCADEQSSESQTDPKELDDDGFSKTACESNSLDSVDEESGQGEFGEDYSEERTTSEDAARELFGDSMLIEHETSDRARPQSDVEAAFDDLMESSSGDRSQHFESQISAEITQWRRDESFRRQTNWQRVFRNKIFDALSSARVAGTRDLSYDAINHHQPQVGVRLPGMVGYSPEVTLILDVSGSMLCWLHDSVLELQEIVKRASTSFGVTPQWILADEEVKLVGRGRDVEGSLPEAPSLLGGTDLMSVIATVMKRNGSKPMKGIKTKPDLIVLISDGEFFWGDNPKILPDHFILGLVNRELPHYVPEWVHELDIVPLVV